MNFDSKRGFILLDVLLGVGLFVAVALLCGYSRMFVQNFTATSAKLRHFAFSYYHLQESKYELVKVTFEFLQQGQLVGCCDDELIVIQDPKFAKFHLITKK